MEPKKVRSILAKGEFFMDKEALRQKWKEAYQKAKAKRDADPKYQALKERMNEARRAKYRNFQDQKKKAKDDERKKKRTEKDAALMALMKPASQLEQEQSCQQHLSWLLSYLRCYLLHTSM